MIISSLGSLVASDAGFVKVKPTLQLINHPEIFAMGDILDLPEQKQLAKALAHADILAANIPRYLSNPGTTLTQYGGMRSRENIVISNGKVSSSCFVTSIGS